jgi:thiol-disulfide isomerase/thioredoxin
MAIRMSKKTWIIVAIVIIAVGAIVGTALSRNSSSPSDSTPQPQEALNFTLPTMTGVNVTLSELEGTPVVLIFWATWCPHCPTELHRLEDVAQQSGEIKVIAIDVSESASRVQNFFGDYEPTMIIALDSNGEAFVDYCQKYGNSGYIPFTLFVDSEGLVKYVKIGAFSSETELWDTLSSVFEITVPHTS